MSEPARMGKCGCCNDGGCDLQMVTVNRAQGGFVPFTHTLSDELTKIYLKGVLHIERQRHAFIDSPTYGTGPGETCDTASRDQEWRIDWWEFEWEFSPIDGNLIHVKFDSSCVASHPIYEWTRTACQPFEDATVIDSGEIPPAEYCANPCELLDGLALDCFFAPGGILDPADDSTYKGCLPGYDDSGMLIRCQDLSTCSDPVDTITEDTFQTQRVCADDSNCSLYRFSLSIPFTKVDLKDDTLSLLSLITIPTGTSGVALPVGCVGVYDGLSNNTDKFGCRETDDNFINFSLGATNAWCSFGGRCPTIKTCILDFNDQWPGDPDPGHSCFNRTDGTRFAAARRPSAFLLINAFISSLAFYEGKIPSFLNPPSIYWLASAGKMAKRLPDGLACEFMHRQIWDAGISGYAYDPPTIGDDPYCVRSAPIPPDTAPDTFVFQPTDLEWGLYYWPEPFNNRPADCCPP